MDITFKRHYKLILGLVVLIILLLVFGSVRIISYNIGEGGDVGIANLKDYKNTIDIFDDTIVHGISIRMDEKDYNKMIETYTETQEKDYFKVDITIDGITVEDAGIRLKGNLSLMQALGTDMGGMQKPENFEGFNQEGLLDIDQNTANNLEVENPFSEVLEEVESNPPFLVKFDEYVSNQTYEGLHEIALRITNDKSLLNEQIAYYIHESVEQIVPETAYAYVEVTGQDPGMYVLCESINEDYIDKNFPDSDGILYKAGNFVAFKYLGEDPTLYTDNFEQVTSLNDDDSYYLIRFLKFVTDSSDEEFENNLENWIDVNSLIRMMILDDLLQNNDSFSGMGSNYYLYYNKNTSKFTVLSWDLNLALGMMGGMGDRGDETPTQNFPPMDGEFPNLENLPIRGEKPNLEDIPDFRNIPRFDMNFEQDKQMEGMGRSGENLLKDRLLANEQFKEKYDEEYSKLSDLLFTQKIAVTKIEELSETFTKFNSEKKIIDQTVFESAVAKITTFFEKVEGNEENNIDE